MKKISIILNVFMAFLLLCIFIEYVRRPFCKEVQPYDLPFSNIFYSSVNDYLNTISNIEKVENNPTDTIKTTFCFANNPYNFDKKSILVIYANNKKVYEDSFCSAVTISLQQFEGSLIHFGVQILYPTKKAKYTLYRFANKSVMYWEKEYKIVYACFFPTNQDIDRIHFFPAKYDVIQ